MTRWLAPVVAMAVVSIAVSYTWPLFALMQERAGYSGLLIGLNATAAAVMMVVAAPIMPGVLARLGLIRLMLCSVVAIALCYLLIPVFYDFWWWMALRMVLGFAITAMFFAAEYWLVEIAPEEKRGRIVALYAMILSGSYAIGPAMLRVVGLETYWTFALPALLTAAGAIPVILWRGLAPPAQPDRPASPLETVAYFRSDPLIMWGVVLFGMIEFGAMGLASVWAVRSGLPEAEALTLLSAMAIGSILFQIPVGWAADRFDRRRLLMIMGLGAMVAPLVMIAGRESYALVLMGSILWGGMAVALYTLALTELGARYTGASLAAGNAAVVLAYGLGALVAPAAFGQAMDAVPPDGLMWLAAMCGGVYAALALARVVMKPRNPLDMGRQNSR